jgi:hypothetical protein
MRANSQLRSVKAKIDDMMTPMEQDLQNLFSQLSMPIPKGAMVDGITIADDTYACQELSSMHWQILQQPVLLTHHRHAPWTYSTRCC